MIGMAGIKYGKGLAEQERAAAFIRDRVTQSSGRYFLTWNGDNAIGFMHLVPSATTLAMRPIRFLEDLYVDGSARGQYATALLSYAEAFARGTGTGRLRTNGCVVTLMWVPCEQNTDADNASSDALTEHGIEPTRRTPDPGWTARLGQMGEQLGISAVVLGGILDQLELPNN